MRKPLSSHNAWLHKCSTSTGCMATWRAQCHVARNRIADNQHLSCTQHRSSMRCRHWMSHMSLPSSQSTQKLHLTANVTSQSSSSNSSATSLASVEEGPVSCTPSTTDDSVGRLREILNEGHPDGIVLHSIGDGTQFQEGPAGLMQRDPSAAELESVTATAVNNVGGSMGLAPAPTPSPAVVSTLSIVDERVPVPRLDDTLGPVYSSSLSSHLIVELPVKVPRPEVLPAPWSANASSTSIKSKSHLPPRPPAPQASPQKVVRGGIKVKEALMTICVGLAVQFLCPCPTGLAPQAWTLFAIFCTTVSGKVVYIIFLPISEVLYRCIAMSLCSFVTLLHVAIPGLVLEPLPVGAWALCCLTSLTLSGATTFQVRHRAALYGHS